MLAFVAENFGYGDGGSQSANDVLLSLLANQYPLLVSSRNRCRVPAEVGGISVAQPAWSRWPIGRRSSVILDRWLSYRLESTLERMAPQLFVHNSFPPPQSYVHERFREWGRSAMIVRCCPDYFDLPEKWDDRYTMEWALETMDQFDSLIFVSHRCHQEWKAIETVARKKTLCVPNCCREEAIERLAQEPRIAVRRRVGFPDDRFVMVCVASLQPHKGQLMLLEAMPEMRRIAPDLILYLVGGPSNRAYVEKLRSAVASWGLEDCVRFTGLRKDVLEVMYGADLFVLPSRTEAFGLVVLEAMALQTPVLASRRGGIQDLVVDGESGLLFSAEERDEMVHGFEKLYRDEALRHTFADRGYERFRSNFSREHHIRGYGAVVEAILSS